uniref:Uncharacterized protein n=1 Tax=Octopus bimaculoides TaxID=37653 RepID=A0A0L8HEW8_OCTBM
MIKTCNPNFGKIWINFNNSQYFLTESNSRINKGPNINLFIHISLSINLKYIPFRMFSS